MDRAQLLIQSADLRGNLADMESEVDRLQAAPLPATDMQEDWFVGVQSALFRILPKNARGETL